MLSFLRIHLSRLRKSPTALITVIVMMLAMVGGTAFATQTCSHSSDWDNWSCTTDSSGGYGELATATISVPSGTANLTGTVNIEPQKFTISGADFLDNYANGATSFPSSDYTSGDAVYVSVEDCDPSGCTSWVNASASGSYTSTNNILGGYSYSCPVQYDATGNSSHSYQDWLGVMEINGATLDVTYTMAC